MNTTWAPILSEISNFAEERDLIDEYSMDCEYK